MLTCIIYSLLSGSHIQSIAYEEKKSDFVNKVPIEITHEIFSYLNSQELARCLGVNKSWKVLANDEALWKALTPKIAFGKKEWEKYFGDIGLEPPLPTDIREILKSPCPFWPGKKVGETHMLVLIPETINGKPLNLITLGELVKLPKEGHAAQYRHIWDAVINEHGNQAPGKSHWVLMTKDAIPGSDYKSYKEQQDHITKLAINYEVPNILDASICMFMHCISSGKRFFWLYTLCRENVQSYQIVLGSFLWIGPAVFANVYGSRGGFGVAALRKF